MASSAQTRNWIGTIDWSFASRTGFWLEAMWLSALALVPILFSYNNSLVTFDETKSYALHFFALMTLVLLVADTINNFLLARQRGENPGGFDVLEWARADRANLLLGAVVVFTFVYMITTALSQSPYYSFWGVTIGLDGYNLYTLLSMIIIFFAVVTRVQNIAQVWRILYLIVTVGVIVSIYGTSQHFGWDPVGILNTPDRVFPSFGNPIYFGAYLVMSIPITMSIALDPKNTNRKIILVGIAVAVGLQLAAMWFTGSRGPLVGLVGAVFVTAIAMLVLVNRKQLFYAAAAVVGALVVTTVLLVIPGGGGDARAVQFSGELSAFTDQQDVGFIQGGLGGRSEIWRDALEISTSWDTFQEDKPLNRALRPLFGLGPDMLRFSSSLVSRPRSSLEIVDHAHNRALQVLAELGWVGFTVFVAIIGLISWLLFLIAKNLYRGRHETKNTGTTIMYIAVAGALAGVAGEQLSGVGRISDLLTSWILIGLVVVLYRRVSTAQVSEESEAVVLENKPRRKKNTSRTHLNRAQSMAAVPFFTGVMLLVAALMTFVLVDVQILRASKTILGQADPDNLVEAYDRFINAREIAPQVEKFTTISADVLIEASKRLNAIGNQERAAANAGQAFDLLLDYHNRNPLGIRTRILLAETAALLVDVGVLEFQEEMVLRYEELVAQFPNEARVLSVMANAYAAAELYDKSLAMADRSLALEPLTEPLPSAWWIRGVALDRLGRDSEAVVALETAIEKGPDTQFELLSHKDLAKVYGELGNPEMSEFHRLAAEEIENRA